MLKLTDQIVSQYNGVNWVGLKWSESFNLSYLNNFVSTQSNCVD